MNPPRIASSFRLGVFTWISSKTTIPLPTDVAIVWKLWVGQHSTSPLTADYNLTTIAFIPFLGVRVLVEGISWDKFTCLINRRTVAIKKSTHLTFLSPQSLFSAVESHFSSNSLRRFRITLKIAYFSESTTLPYQS
jgi:hypothetical protein